MKKILPMILTVTTAISLSSCGEKTYEENTSNDEVVTITVVNKVSPEEAIIYKEFLEAVEVNMEKTVDYDLEFELIEVQSGTYSEKLGLLLQSGTIPDLIYFQGGDEMFAQQNILEDLTPYIANSESVQASMNKFNIERMASYPYLMYLSQPTVKVPVVPKSFFENTSIKGEFLNNPTVENYYTLFKELKENNGTDYAITVPGNLSELDTIFDQAFGNTTTWLSNGDGTFEFSKISEYEKNKLEFYAKLYADGLLDPEFLTKQWDTKEKAFYENEVAVISGTQGKVIDLYNSRIKGNMGEEESLISLPPAVGVAQGYLPVDVSKETRGFAISAYSENKQEVFDVIEYMTSPEGQLLDKVGYEGTQYEVVDDKIKLLPEFSSWYEWFSNNTINFDLTMFHEETPFLSIPAQDSLNLVANFGTNDNTFIIPVELAAYYDSAMSIYNEFAVEVITGKASIEDFDAYVEKFMTNGGMELHTYANELLNK